MTHVNLRVSGKVQGVFYRASAKEKADQLKLKGYVQNDPNGFVYIEVEGPEEDVNLFVEWCRRGPAQANVQKVEVVTSDIEFFKNFEIRR